MKKKIRKKPNICSKLRFEAAFGIRRLQFLLLEYRFFKDSEGGSALILSLPWLLFPLSLTFHIIKTHALDLLTLPCYFVKLKTRIVALWAIQENHDTLLVASLAVAKDCRWLGIGTYVLGYIETIARHLGKRQMEVEVLKKNIPAQRFYTQYGFTFLRDERTNNIMRGKKPL